MATFLDGTCNSLRITPLHLQTLDILYSDDKQPTQSRLKDYALGLGLTYEQVKRWFVERRRKDVRDAARASGIKEAVKSASSRKKTKKKETLSRLDVRGDENCTRKGNFVQDMLHSPDYIFKKIFRKDGPPLGVEFDPLPDTAFQDRNKIADDGCCEEACQSERRASKRRKVTKPANFDSEQCTQMDPPVKKHGKGKGLMSVWQLVNSHASKETSRMLPSKHSYPLTRHGMGKGFMSTQLVEQNFKRKPQKRKPAFKAKDKRKPIARRRKVESTQKKNQRAQKDCCRIALGFGSFFEKLCPSPLLEDDEELELREMQDGPNPPTCGAHFGTNGSQSHGCSLCKGLLPKFPPDFIRMRKPLSMHPWNSSLEFVKKLFKAFHFLYTYGVVLDLCLFTLDEFAMAFHDKDSLLLGKLHVSLLSLLLSDIQKEIFDGLSIHSSKNGRLLNLLHKAETQNIVNFWEKSLNPLTWSEIWRQVVGAAGFGSKDCSQSKECHTKEPDHMTKYGLHHGTLKGEIFSILFEQGNKGMRIAELSNCSQITKLSLGKTNGELEDSICSILAGDITLFEKISSSTYRLRLNSIMKKDDETLSEDGGTIYDDSRVSSNAECDSSNFDQSSESNTLPLSSVIDESLPGESWVLGLVEGEYSNLSVKEKLDALLALIDLVSAGPSVRMEDPSAAITECVPSIYQHGSGAKIKRSSSRRPSLLNSSCTNRGTCDLDDGHRFSDICPVDSSVILSTMSEKNNFSGKKKCSNGSGNEDNLHPIQSIFLGSDRRYNRYWIFLGPCDANDPGHKRVYFESSEDGQWQVIDSGEALYDLLATLNDQGRREANLLASLEKLMPFLLEEISSSVPVDVSVSQSTQSGLSEVDRFSEESPSPISDIDNLSLGETSCHVIRPSSAEKKFKVQKQTYENLQAFDSWIWDSFYSNLHSVRHRKLSYFDSWVRCGSCNDLYWRDERHCKICHTTFELDLDLEEKYTIHLATCGDPKNGDIFPVHKVLPSKLQALKAAVHVIEVSMPEDAMIGAWKKSAHKLWVRRLKRTSSLLELFQVLGDFVGSINVDWVSRCKISHNHDSPIDDLVAHFKSMPQTSSALALWLVNLDSLIALQLDGLST